MYFFEFTEESWNEQLTRPWLYEPTPSDIFPGGGLIITGTRFADTDRVVINGLSLNPTINADESLSVTIPANIPGREKDVYVRRFDGDQSNYLRLWQISRLFMFLLTRLILYFIDNSVKLTRLLYSNKDFRNSLFNIRLEQS